MTEDIQGLSWEEGKTGVPLIFHFILDFVSFSFIIELRRPLALAKKDVDILKSHNLKKELRSPLGVRAMKVAEP